MVLSSSIWIVTPSALSVLPWRRASPLRSSLSVFRSLSILSTLPPVLHNSNECRLRAHLPGPSPHRTFLYGAAACFTLVFTTGAYCLIYVRKIVKRNDYDMYAPWAVPLMSAMAVLGLALYVPFRPSASHSNKDMYVSSSRLTSSPP